jgi:hypothetical protein
MCERIHAVAAYIWVGFKIKGSLEIGAGITAFTTTMHEVMKKRIHAGAPHVLITLQIPPCIE